ncbi:MAG TPA: peptidoglycan DD-metalloendopeptidase family protein [Chitinophagaceae bacterium]|nr:peptidoglycan DD-metalloendopeptidase family protein [Chitinophagaceae bacterium]
MRFQSLLFFLGLIFSLSLSVSAQNNSTNRKDLEKRRASLLKEIEATQKLLQSTEKDRKATVSELRAIQAQLNARQQLINNINSEINHIDEDIKNTSKEIDILNDNLEIFKMRYAQSVRYAYRNRTSQSMVAFLFSAKNFNDGIRRIQYLKRYKDSRKDQADDIRKTQIALNAKIENLNSNKIQKSSLLSAEEAQKLEIQESSEQTNKMVQELQGREKELLTQIKNDQRVADRLQNAIQAEIKKEIELARKRAEEEAAARRKAEEEARRIAKAEEAKRLEAERRKREQESGGVYNSGQGDVILNTGRNIEKKENDASTIAKVETRDDDKTSTTKPASSSTSSSTPSYKLSLTPEVKTISDNFTANKGKLPWPVNSGFISGKFGKHPHPVYKTVMTENNGIDITTSANAEVRAVSSGTVIRVMNIDGYVVMINHGEYFTIYSNLSKANVSVGQKVDFKQGIGNAGRNSEGVPTINFQIWRVGENNATQTVNPEHWIAPN